MRVNTKWLIGCGVGFAVFLIIATVFSMLSHPAVPEDELETVTANVKGENKEEVENLDYKRLPVDVDEFVTDYEAIAMISDREPLPITDKLIIEEDQKANFISLYKDFDSGNYPPTIFNLVLNKKDNTLRSIAYVGPIEIDTFINIINALDIADDPKIKTIHDEYLKSPTSYENQVQLETMELRLKSTNGTLTYSFTGY
jgi:hypothetical protein